MVDAHCKWPEVIGPMKTTADPTINAMRNIFARYGLLTQVLTTMAHPSSLESMKSSCGKMAFREFWFPLTIPLQMGWMSGLGRLSSTQWSHQLTIPQALFSDGTRIFSFLTEAHHTVLPTHPPPSYSYSENFALDCLWLHLILDLAWPASKTK